MNILGGTCNGNPLSMTTGVAAVTEMRDNRDNKETICSHLMEQGNRLASEATSSA